MTHVNSGLARQSREGLGLLPATVAGVFIFVIWKSSGMSFSLSPSDGENFEELAYAELEQRAAGNASIIGQLVWFVFGCVGLYLHTLNRDRAVLTWSRAWPLLVLLVVIALSFLWSSVPDIALRRIVKHLLLVAAMAGVVMGAGSPREVLRLAVVITGVMMAMNYASLLLFPAAATDAAGAFKGMHGHKNTAGQFVMVAVFVWLTAARWSQGAWTRAALYLGTVLWFLFLLGTVSRTSILATIVGITFILPLKYCIRRPRAGIIISLFTALSLLSALFVAVILNVSFADFIDFLEGEKTTLTGRTAVWAIAYEAFQDHTLLGTGYGSLWSTGGAPPAEQYSDLPLTSFLVGLTQAHSGYFDVLASLGLVGVAAFSIFLGGVIGTVTRGFASTSEDDAGLRFAELTGFLLLGSLVYNLTQTTFTQDDVLWIGLLLCYLMMCSIRPADTAVASSRAERARATDARPERLSRPPRG